MNKTILITGASSGIGRATASALVGRGARVVMVGRSLTTLREAAAALPSAQAHVIAADVTIEADVARMLEEALAFSPHIDVLVNNAGVASTGHVETLTLDAWNRMMATNLTAVFLCSRALVSHMRSRGGGLIVNMGSTAGKQAYPEWSAYCATKFGLVGFSRALQEEVRAHGIRVTLLQPGGVDTPLWSTFPNTFDRSRMMSANDVAEAIAYIAEQPPHVAIDELTLGPLGGAQ